MLEQRSKHQRWKRDTGTVELATGAGMPTATIRGALISNRNAQSGLSSQAGALAACVPALTSSSEPEQHSCGAGVPAASPPLTPDITKASPCLPLPQPAREVTGLLPSQLLSAEQALAFESLLA